MEASTSTLTTCKEQHFHEAHYPCTQSQCLAQKFVVFGTALDLKGHIVEEHGGDMNSKDRRDARRVVADFAFEDAGGRYGHGRRESRDHHEREREREPPPLSRRPPSPTIPRPPGQSRRREAFGARLTVDGVPIGESASFSSQANLEANLMQTSGTDDMDPAVVEYVIISPSDLETDSSPDGTLLCFLVCSRWQRIRQQRFLLSRLPCAGIARQSQARAI